MFIFALALTTPVPFTQAHQRDIGCVAMLGLLADEQRRGVEDNSFPDVTQTGRTYAGIVGARVMVETGLPREIVAQAIMTAAADVRAKAGATLAGKTEVRTRLTDCLGLMQNDLLVSAPLSKPVKQ